MILLLADTNKDIFYGDMIKTITVWRDSVGIDSAMTEAGISLGIALCGLFAFVWTAAKLYPVIAGDEKLSFLPILRPFVICLVIFNWTSFVDLVRIPGNAMENAFNSQFESSWTELKAKSAERYDKLQTLSKLVFTGAVEVERAEEAERSAEIQSSDISQPSTSSGFSISDLNPLNLSKNIAHMAYVVQMRMRQLFVMFLEWLALLFMNVVVCGVFFMQAVCMIILIILGPLAFAFSCTDAWSSSWSKWVARFFSVTLWSGLGWLVCWMGSEIILEVIQSDINNIQAQIEKGEAVLVAAASMSGYDLFLMPLLCLFIAFGMFIIFPVSTWIIETGGATSIISAPAGAAATTAGAAVAVGSMAAGKMPTPPPGGSGGS